MVLLLEVLAGIKIMIHRVFLIWLTSINFSWGSKNNLGYKFKQHLRDYFMTSVLNVDIVFWIGDVLNRKNLGIYFAKFDIYLSKYKTVLIICLLQCNKNHKTVLFFCRIPAKNLDFFGTPPPKKKNEPSIKTSSFFAVVFYCTIKVYFLEIPLN